MTYLSHLPTRTSRGLSMYVMVLSVSSTAVIRTATDLSKNDDDRNIWNSET